jgi:hypothetical protein
LQVAELQHLKGHLLGFPEGINAAEGGGHDILKYSHTLERLDHLKGTANAKMTDLVGLHPFDAFSFEKDVAGSQRKVVVDKVEDGGFARTVGANKSEDFSTLNFETHIIHRHEPAEVLADLSYCKETHRLHRSSQGISFENTPLFSVCS